MLKHRIATAIVGLPLVIAAIWFGFPLFSVLIAAAALVGTYEFCRMAGFGRREPLLYLGLLVALALVLSPHYGRGDPGALHVVLTTSLLVSLILLLVRKSTERAFQKWAWTMAGALYVGWLLSYWLNLRGLEDGRAWSLLAIFTAFANDTGAFFVGRARGRHKLAPAISPAKTWEGAIGGLICAILCAVAVGTILNLVSPYVFACWQIVVLGILIGVFAQIGDLVESLLKRSTGAKESGRLLPGHGGILDRFDSIIFVGAVAYYYVLWVV
jgi:phosphatidate cytidylyltransferase